MMDHLDRIRDQFTKQVEAFSSAAGIRDEEALKLLVEFSGAGPEDTVLDVACGPGLVVAAFAGVARRATGIDITAAMLEKAGRLAKEKGLENVDWKLGDVLPLPFPGASFSIAVSRFAFHHFLDPGAVLQEMARVARPGGKVVMADVMASRDPAKAAAYDRMKKLRDPSHVRALPLAEMEDLFREAGLTDLRKTYYRLECALEDLLQRSFPDPGGAEKVREMIIDALETDGLGIPVWRIGEEVRLAYPIAILAAERPLSKNRINPLPTPGSRRPR